MAAPAIQRTRYSQDDLYRDILSSANHYKPIVIGPFDIKEYLGKKGVLKQGPAGVLQEKKFRAQHDEKFMAYVAKRIDHIYRLYSNAYDGGTFPDDKGGSLGQKGIKVLGSMFLRDKAIARVEQGNLGLLDYKSKGAILCDEKWDLLANDAVMLGAIHAKQDALIWTQNFDPQTNQLRPMVLDKSGHPTVDREIIWSDEDGRLRVTGREIAQLIAGGYAALQHGNQHTLGIHLVNVQPEAAQKLTLEKCCIVAAKLNEQAIYRFLHNGGISLDELMATTGKQPPEIGDEKE